MEEVDVVVIGSGIGGLSCAAALARYGLTTAVCESHSVAGGSAHAFERKGYTFDSGPSFFSGLAEWPSPNPLAQVLRLADAKVDVTSYKSWVFYLPEGPFRVTADGKAYAAELRRVGGERAGKQWARLEALLAPLVGAAQALPPAALRFDLGALRTTAKYLPGVLSAGPLAALLQRPFADVMALAGVDDPFLRNMLDLECFVLSGVPSRGTITAEMAFIFSERNLPTATVDYPMGGAGAVVDALVESVERADGCSVHTNAHVEEVLMDGGRAAGVRLRGGRTLRARRAVVSNAPAWETSKLIAGSGAELARAGAKTAREKADLPKCASFMHLHAGIDAAGLPDDLECHHVIVNRWDGPGGVEEPQNVVIISIPSVFDPSLAPEGKHVVHVYTAGNEPYELWEGLERGSPEYEALKEERSQCLWEALERIIPDVRERAELALIGTPLTHERFLRRSGGSYGPAVEAGKAAFPGPGTDVEGLYCCGDSTLPGIGVPAVAASGLMAANTIADVDSHVALLEELGL